MLSVVVAYADVSLVNGLQKMINICEVYACEFDIIFNGLKIQFLFFRGRDCIDKKYTIIVDNCLNQH